MAIPLKIGENLSYGKFNNVTLSSSRPEVASISGMNVVGSSKGTSVITAIRNTDGVSLDRFIVMVVGDEQELGYRFGLGTQKALKIKVFKRLTRIIRNI